MTCLNWFLINKRRQSSFLFPNDTLSHNTDADLCDGFISEEECVSAHTDISVIVSVLGEVKVSSVTEHRQT